MSSSAHTHTRHHRLHAWQQQHTDTAPYYTQLGDEHKRRGTYVQQIAAAWANSRAADRRRVVKKGGGGEEGGAGSIDNIDSAIGISEDEADEL
jgi:hypothetical protein